MKTYTHIGCYGEGPVYVMETLEDFDEYEKFLNEKDLMQYNPNFNFFKDAFQKYIGKIWQDKDQLRYCLNGEPVYVEYKIIALEYDDANADWYWVCQNVNDDRDIKYILSLRDIKENIKC